MTARSSEDSRGATRSGSVRFLQWLFLTSVVMTTLTLCAVHAPSRIKLLGLFAIAYGLLAGWNTGQLAHITGIHSRRIVAIVSFAVIIAGQVGMAVESYRLYHRFHAAELRRLYQSDPMASLMKHIPVPKQLGDQAQLKTTLEQNRQERDRKLAVLIRRKTSFSAYLRNRVSSLRLSQPWAVLLWAVDMALASAAGTFFAVRVANGNMPK